MSKNPHLTPTSYLAAWTHETRIHAISVLTDRTASPAEIARELDREIRHVTYHIEVLQDLGLVELVRTEPAAGGRTIQKFYRATQRIWFDREAWTQMTGPKAKITAAIMALINQDIAISMRAGVFDGKENHISRTPMLLDEAGYEELIEFLKSALVEIFEIKERAAARITKDSKTVMTITNIIQFDLPESGWSFPPDDDPSQA